MNYHSHHKVWRSAVTGQYITEADAEASPDESVKETITAAEYADLADRGLINPDTDYTKGDKTHRPDYEA